MSKTTTLKGNAGWYTRVTRGTSLYGLELIISTIGLLVIAGVLTYSAYVLCNHLAGVSDVSTRQFVGEFSVWLVAAMIVWLPMALFFYMRTRAEVAKHQARETTLLHKLIVGSYKFTLLMGIIALLFSVVYTSIRLLIGIEDNPGDLVLRVIVPGVVAAIINSGLIAAYNRSRRPSRALFSVAVAIVSVLAMLAVLFVSVGSIRDEAKDTRTVNDLTVIENQINDYYYKEQTIPDRLDQLKSLKQEVRNRLGDYTYVRVSEERYRLCATFVTDTYSDDTLVSSRPTIFSDDTSEYSSYANFWLHDTGQQCYNLTTYYAAYPLSKDGNMSVSSETNTY